MAKGLNLRAIFTADTADIEKGSKRATQSIRTFEKESSGLFAKFADMLGVNTSKIGQMASAVEGLGAKTAAASAKSASTIAKVSGAFRLLGGAIGGVAAVGTAAWTAMSREADYYGTRLDGLGKNAGLKAYQDTLKALRHDHRDGAGIQEFVIKVKKAWASLGNRIQAFFRGDVSVDEDISKAGRAEEIATEMSNLDMKQMRSRERISELEWKIADARRQAADTELSFTQRQAAASSLAGMINEKSAIQVKYLQEKLKLQRELNGITESSDKDLEAEISLSEQLNQAKRSQQMELREALEATRSVSTSLQASIAQLQNEWMAGELENLELAVQLNDEELLSELEALKPVLEGEIASLNASLTPVSLSVDPAPMVKTMDLLPVLEDGFKSAFSNIGTYIGEALTGNENAAGNFSAAMLSTLGDMAIKVGELAVSTGLALSGIKAALESMNPYVAIAAGAALIALGAAVKAGAANIAKGTGGYSSSSVSSSYGAGASSDYTTRDISVNVTGTLVANGSQLVAVLNNENKRKNLTT